MKKTFFLIIIVTTLLCSCKKINLYPVFEESDNIVYIEDRNAHTLDSLSNIIYNTSNSADSLQVISDSLRLKEGSPCHRADSLEHIADSLYHSADSLWDVYKSAEQLYYWGNLKQVNVLSADSCTVYVPFLYARDTKSIFNIYDCHAVTGRATSDGTVLCDQSIDRKKFFSHSDSLDSLKRRYVNFPYSLLYQGNSYIIKFKIPANDSPSSRVITFEYSYQIRTFFSKWSDWIYISSIEQSGSDTADR